MKVTQHYCNCCEAPRPFEKSGASHVLHLVLTIFTTGFWLPVWLVFAIAEAMRPGRCRACGWEAKRQSSVWTKELGPFKSGSSPGLDLNALRVRNKILAERRGR